MAPRTITQRIALEGAEEIKQNLASLGQAGSRAFDDMRRGAANANFQGVQRDLQAVGAAATRLAENAARLATESTAAAEALKQTGTEAAAAADGMQKASAGAEQAAAKTKTFAASLSSLLKVAGGVAAGLTAVGAAILKVASDASNAANDINKNALKADVGLADYQEATFALKQLGLTAGEAESAIKKIGEVGATAFEKGKAALKELGTVFPDTTAGAEQAARRIEQLNKVTINGKKPIDDLTAAAVRFHDGITSDALAGFADQLKGMREEAAKALVVKVLGEELGRSLLPALRKGGEHVRSLTEDFAGLKLGIDDTQADIGVKYVAAMERFKDATKQGRTELGLLFAPATTGAITTFTDLLRRNANTFREWGETASTTIQSVINDIGKLIQGDDQIENKWILTLRDAFMSLGETVSGVFKNTILPALEQGEKAIRFLLDTFNEFFGTEITFTDLGIAGALTALLGPIGAVAAALAALFTSNSPAIQTFKEQLKSIGIDVDGIKQKIVDFAASVRRDLTLLKDGLSGGDLENQWLVGLRDILKQLPAILVSVGGAFLVFGRAVQFVGVGRAAVLWLSQLTGVLPAVTTLMVGVAAAFSVFFTVLTGVIGILALLVGGPAAVATAFVAAATAIILGWETVREVLKFVGVDVDALEKKFKELFPGMSPPKKLQSDWEEFKRVFKDEGIFAALANDFKKSWEGSSFSFEPLKEMIRDVVDYFTDTWNQFFRDIDQANQQLIQDLKAPWEAFVNFLIGLWEKFLGVLGQKPSVPAPEEKAAPGLSDAADTEAFSGRRRDSAARSIADGIRDTTEIKKAETAAVKADVAAIKAEAQLARLQATAEKAGKKVVTTFDNAGRAIRDMVPATNAATAALSGTAAGFEVIGQDQPKNLQEFKDSLVDTGLAAGETYKILKDGSLLISQTTQDLLNAGKNVGKSFVDAGQKIGPAFTEMKALSNNAFTEMQAGPKKLADSVKSAAVASQGSLEGAFDSLGPTFANLADAFGPLEQEAKTVGPAVAKAFDPVTTAVDTFKSAMGALAPIVDQSFGVAEQGVNDFKSRFGELPAATDLFKSALGTLAPILDQSLGAAGRGVSDLKSRFNELPDTTDAFKAKLNELPPVVSQAFTATASAIDTFKFKFDGLPNTTDAFKSALGTLAPIVDQSLGAAEQGVSNLKSRFDELPTTTDAFKAKLNQLSPVVSQAFTAAGPAIDTFNAQLSGLPATADAFKASLTLLPTTIGQAFATAGPPIDAFKAQFSGLPTTADAFKASITQLAPVATQAFGAIGPAVDQSLGVAEQSVNDLKSRLGELPGAIQGFVPEFNQLPSLIERAATAATTLGGAFTTGLSGVTGLIDGITTSIGGLIEQINAAISKLQELASAQAESGASSFDEAGFEGFARGGHVRGPGTSTSDSILARLSRGEFVQREKAVRYYGTDFMAALNALRIPKDMFRGFNAGGLVDGLNQSLSALMIPRFNVGGLTDMAPAASTASGRPFILQVGGRNHPAVISGPASTIRAIEREAIADQPGKTGRSPSWVR